MNIHPESKRFLRRSLTSAIIIFVFFLLLFVRLFYLQIVKNGFYATLSKRNVISIVPVQPNRGIIYDRNGVVLAKNIPVYSLMVIPGRVKNMENTINSLKKVVDLTSHDIKNFDHIVKQYYPYQDVPLKQQLTEKEVDQFYVEQYRFPGVMVQTNMIRDYPLGAALSNVVGYVSRITASELAIVNPSNYTASDDIGKAGVEAEDETLLHGVMGSEEAEINANGKIVRVLKTTPAVPGDNLYLTIDSKLQLYAEKIMGKNSGGIVAIQPATGQMLALVSKPGYNPNWFVKGLSEKQYQSLLNNPNHPLFNRATHATYAPGSTIKPFYAFNALNNGIIDTDDYIFDPGYFRLPGTKHIFHNWVRTGFGWVNVTKAITVSCDTFFYQLAAATGIDQMDRGLKQFGFGSKTGIDLPMENTGIVPSPQWKMKTIGQPWYSGDTVNVGIGQGYIAVTPIQLAAATATIAEHGLRFQPTVLLKLTEPNGTGTMMQPVVEKPIMQNTPHAWSTVIHAMQDVIMKPDGTAYPSFQNISYTAAGKTGTAQVAADNTNGNVAQTGRRFQNDHLFIVFAPVKNPQIVIAVAIEHIAGMTQQGVAIARQLLDFYMQEIKQQQKDTEKVDATLPSIPVPKNNISISLPIPAGNATIRQELKNDLQTELSDQKKQPKKNTSEQLMQQMDMKVDTQLDLLHKKF